MVRTVAVLYEINLEGLLVGAEGFEVSFPSDHYAVFFVEFNGKTPENQGLAKILRHALDFPIFLRMDAIPQEFGITGIIPASNGYTNL
jgi:hypothetical protein